MKFEILDPELMEGYQIKNQGLKWQTELSMEKDNIGWKIEEGGGRREEGCSSLED